MSASPSALPYPRESLPLSKVCAPSALPYPRASLPLSKVCAPSALPYPRASLPLSKVCAPSDLPPKTLQKLRLVRCGVCASPALKLCARVCHQHPAPLLCQRAPFRGCEKRQMRVPCAHGCCLLMLCSCPLPSSAVLAAVPRQVLRLGCALVPRTDIPSLALLPCAVCCAPRCRQRTGARISRQLRLERTTHTHLPLFA